MLVRLIALLILVEGHYCLNSTQKAAEINTTLATTSPIAETSSRQIETHPTVSNSFSLNSTSLNQTNLEIAKIFHGEPNVTTTEQISVNNTLSVTLNVTSSSNLPQNDTFSSNYTTAEVAASSNDDVQPFRLPNWAAIAAGVCVVSGVIGYISCVSYRRFLQRKYGNSQILVGEDVYDTTDLRNFEI